MDGTAAIDRARQARPQDRRILCASLIGTSIEYFDFYAYGTAAVIVFPLLFFPQGDAVSATLQSLATFALAFIARPAGAALFGHLGDRFGRKSTLVTSLLTMGSATIAIGLLPTYESIGVWAPLLLGVCRFAQGLGLGGEWGGAMLLATENAPPGQRAWYAMFPQLGPPIGFLASTSVFLLLTTMDHDDLLRWGWRVPFLMSAALILVGLYVRVQVMETLEYQRVKLDHGVARHPVRSVITQHTRALMLGTLAATAPFAVLYLATVFSLSWATSKLGYTQAQLLTAQMIGMVVLGVAIPVSALLARRLGAKAVLLWACGGFVGFATCFAPLFEAGAFVWVQTIIVAGLALTGLYYGPLGTLLTELFPTPVRYTGISLAFNLAAVLGAAVTPMIAIWLASTFGLHWVGYYLLFLTAVTLAALLKLEGSR